MGETKTVWGNPADVIRHLQPEHPLMVFAPSALHDRARQFLEGFPGMVTYAVKSNPDESVIQNLATAGIQGFDVASPYEIDLIGRLAPLAARHYHNPVRARFEIAHAVRAKILAWSVDSQTELDKLFEQVPTGFDGQQVEISPRFKLPVLGAAYDFGSKFGATPELAADLLRRVADRGYTPSLTFHPGTQCADPVAWQSYIQVARDICDMAGIKARRLNVGGGFPSYRVLGVEPDLGSIFDEIAATVRECFGEDAPLLVCEPGRSLCADAFAVITRVKGVRDGGAVFLNDGVYGSLSEFPLIGNIDRVQLFDPNGIPRQGDPVNRVLFGPTCDSVDRLPGEMNLPGDIQDGGFIVFHGVGAYSLPTNTRFNGFGAISHATAMSLE
jgi:ornithine decarboxylase